MESKKRKTRIVPDAAMPEPGQIFVHWKHGGRYKIIEVSRFNGEDLPRGYAVTYRAIDDTGWFVPESEPYTRTVAEFTCEVMTDGPEEPRWARRFVPWEPFQTEEHSVQETAGAAAGRPAQPRRQARPQETQAGQEGESA